MALVAYRALSDVAAKGSLLIVTVAAARTLTGHAFGIFSLASTFGWMVAVTTDFGIQLHVARSVAARPADAPATLRRWLRVRLTTAGAALAAVAAIAWTLPSPSDRAAVMLLAVAYVASGLVEFLHYFYRGLGRSDAESSLTLAQRGAVLVLALAALAWRPSLVPLAVAMTLPVVATLGVSLSYAVQLANRSPERAAPQVRLAGRADRSGPTGRADRSGPTGRADRSGPTGRADRSGPTGSADGSGHTGSAGLSGLRPISDELRHDVIPIGAGIILSALYFRIDLFLVEIWRGTGAVALYNGVFRLVEALRLFPAAVVAVALPALCRAGDIRPAGRAALAVAAPAIAGTALLFASASWSIPLVLGPRYLDAVTAFRILLLAFPLMSINYVLTHQLIGWHGQAAYAVVCACALAANLALNRWLIPSAGIEGAAWATLWTEIVVGAGCGLALRRQMTRVAA